MSKYKVNKERILDILKRYDLAFYITNDDCIVIESIYSGVFINDELINKIKNNDTSTDYGFFPNVIIQLLHPYFNECFEEIKPKYSYDKCKEFLEDNGFIVHENIVACKCIDNQNETVTVTDSFDYILDKICYGDDSFHLSNGGRAIATILHANKDKLLEE